MRYATILYLALTGVMAQAPFETRVPGESTNRPARLPNGKSQAEAIIKADHEKSLQEVADMKKLILEFSDEFEKSDRNTVSVQTIRKLEEIEKRAKRIRSRLTRP